MKRQVSIEEIWDGRFYGPNDMVKAGCDECRGCDECCRGMGESIILDPLDVHRMSVGLGKSFEELLASSLELHVVDGVILPNLRQSGEREACTFLDENGRCSIHGFRPGVCRLFPMGRYYENGSFQYFLQAGECKKEPKTKVKLKKWLDTPDLKTYETFVNDWHYFLEAAEQLFQNEETLAKNVNLYILNTFYMTPYEAFYEEFSERLGKARAYIGLAGGSR